MPKNFNNKKIKDQMLNDEKYYIKKIKEAIQESIKNIYQYGLVKHKLIIKPAAKQKKNKNSDCFRRVITGLHALALINNFCISDDNMQNIEGRMDFVKIVSGFNQLKIKDIKFIKLGDNSVYDHELIDIANKGKKINLEADTILILKILLSLITFMHKNYDNDSELKNLAYNLKKINFQEETKILCRKIHSILAAAPRFQPMEKSTILAYSEGALIEEIKMAREKVKTKPSFLFTLFSCVKSTNLPKITDLFHCTKLRNTML